VRLAALLAIVAALCGCSTKAKLIAQGGECLEATDCVDGLVCVPQQDGKRICDNDLSGVQSTEDATAPPAKDAAPKDSQTDAPRADADQGDVEQPDTGGGTDAATD
jgi:hypothetical protein